MLVRDRGIAFKRVVSGIPKPDAVFADAGDYRVLEGPAKTLDETDGPAAAQGDDGAIAIFNRQAVVIGDARQSVNVDRCVGLR